MYLTSIIADPIAPPLCPLTAQHSDCATTTTKIAKTSVLHCVYTFWVFVCVFFASWTSYSLLVSRSISVCTNDDIDICKQTHIESSSSLSLHATLQNTLLLSCRKLHLDYWRRLFWHTCLCALKCAHCTESGSGWVTTACSNRPPLAFKWTCVCVLNVYVGNAFATHCS